MTNNYYQKNKEKFRKEAREIYQKLSEEEKTKSTNILVNEIKIFLKKKDSVNMAVNDIKTF